MNDFTELSLIEQPAIELYANLGWDTRDCYSETFGPNGTLGRETRHDVVLIPRLRAALQQLNPGLPAASIEEVVEAIARDRSAMHPVHANQDVWTLLRDGVKVTVRGDRGDEQTATARVIDWNDPANNDYFLASQFWITGEVYSRRPDLVGFVNGLPLVLVELKALTKPLRDAYDDNLRDYRETIPQLFWFNAFIMLSNGEHSLIGTITSQWEHFAEWRRISDEDEPPAVSLETMIRGVCDPPRLLDLVENFTVFTTVSGKPVKIVAKNHQYLGVNRAVAATSRLEEAMGKLGVFWHTQGAGKSFSMLFFSQKVLRKKAGNWTFVVITDRIELDDQIYGTFLDAGAVSADDNVHAESGAHLRKLLAEDHRVVFSLIHKFRSEPGKPYPVLSERSDIIVMTDEAHRTQYAELAMNMRKALPNASFIAFTGTPLIGSDEKTREVFGDYISVYNFQRSIEEKATVPLYYENRVPEMQLVNEQFNDDLERLLDEAMLDDAQEARLEKEFAREYHLITNDSRLDRIAADIVDHYLARYRASGKLVGKAMVVSVDKATTVRMYDKVQKHWKRRIEDLESLPSPPASAPRALSDTERESLPTADWPSPPAPLPTAGEGGTNAVEAGDELAFMRATDMAVVVSQAQNEVADFAAKGLDITPHRQRMIREDLATKFKDPDNPFRIVFVTAMWMTGFDVPSLSTIYLDKPLRHHTLMQTIARANRVFAGKVNGLIVDYIGIFKNLEKALAIYAAGTNGDTPIRPKTELLEKLRAARQEAAAFLEARGVSLEAIHTAPSITRIELLMQAREAVLENDETKIQFLALAATADTYYRAVLPDPEAFQFQGDVMLFNQIAMMIRSLTPPPDISGVMGQVEALIQRSLAAEGYVIRETSADEIVDLSQIDFAALAEKFEKGRKRTETERLRTLIERKVAYLAELNRSRIDYAERLQEVIDEYNRGALNIQLYFEELVKLAQELQEEEKRAVSLGLTEEQMAIFDILTRPGPSLTEKEVARVKDVAASLLTTLKENKLVLDWRKKQQAKAAVRLAIQRRLKRDLSSLYSAELLDAKQELIYQHIYDQYPSSSRWLHAGIESYVR